MAARWALMQAGQVAPPTLQGRNSCTSCQWFRPEKRNKKDHARSGRCGKVADMNNAKRKGPVFDGKRGLECSQYARLLTREGASV